MVEEALPAILGAESLEREPRLNGTGRPDFVARLRDGRAAIVELKIVTPATTARIDRAAAQLRAYGEAFVEAHGGPAPELVLVVSGSLAPERIDRLRWEGVTRVIDGPALRAAAPFLPWPEPAGRTHEPRPPLTEERSEARSLATELERIPPGKSDWVAYQRIVRDILAETLSPPLEQPLDEHRNATGVNRRDIILPNYADEGPWKFLRDHYEAHFIVVDAKNYVGGVKKKDILQVANYLSAHGAGLLGMIVCRDAEDKSAEVTRREQWVIYRKMVLVLNDEDLKTMLALAAAGEDPAAVIRQKIEDFRLGF